MAHQSLVNDAPPTAQLDRSPNVGGAERVLSVLAGLGLAAAGVRKSGAKGALLGLMGGVLIARGAAARDPVKKLLTPTDSEKQWKQRQGWPSAAAVGAQVSIGRSRDELYRIWRDPSNLPEFMEGIESIEVLDARRSRWTVKGPGGRTVSWVAAITDDLPGRRLAWESEPGADIRNAGWVEFRDATEGRGTEVHALIAYSPPAGKLGQFAATLMQKEPGVQARRDLKRFKQKVESGEISVATVKKGGPGAVPSSRSA